MSRKMCRCCLSTNEHDVMVPVNTESSQEDRKSLEDYLNTLFNYSNRSDIEYPKEICSRCCKALQVSYHFVLLSFKSKWKLEELFKTQTILGLVSESESCSMGNPIDKQENEIPIKVNIMQMDKETYKVTIEGAGQGIDTEPELKTIEDSSQQLAVIKSEVSKPLVKHKCRYCPTSFEQHEFLIQHTVREHKYLIPFKCKMCNFCTCNHESLVTHYKRTHQLEDVEQRLYQTKELLTISVEEDSKYDITFKCQQCEYQSHIQTEMDEHLSLEHDIQEDKDNFITTWHNCPSCYRQFTDKTHAKIHYTMTHNMQQINNKLVYTCEKCGKSFDLRTSLASHERICEMREPVTCNFCHLQFASVLKYEQHIQTEHSVAIKYECEICEKSFKSSGYLAAHRKRHNERHYQCELCPKNYINHAELSVHMQRIHKLHKTQLTTKSEGNRKKDLSSQKSIQCEFCEFISTSKFAMEVHQYKHTGRPYKCKFCPKQFVLKKGIKLHCRKCHSFDITDDELAVMFKEKHGYPSRFDAFSNRNNNLLIEEINEMDLAVELQSFNLTLDDIMQDVFDYKNED